MISSALCNCKSVFQSLVICILIFEFSRNSSFIFVCFILVIDWVVNIVFQISFSWECNCNLVLCIKESINVWFRNYIFCISWTRFKLIKFERLCAVIRNNWINADSWAHSIFCYNSTTCRCLACCFYTIGINTVWFYRIIDIVKISWSIKCLCINLMTINRNIKIIAFCICNRCPWNIVHSRISCCLYIWSRKFQNGINLWTIALNIRTTASETNDCS